MLLFLYLRKVQAHKQGLFVGYSNVPGVKFRPCSGNTSSLGKVPAVETQLHRYSTQSPMYLFTTTAYCLATTSQNTEHSRYP